MFYIYEGHDSVRNKFMFSNYFDVFPCRIFRFKKYIFFYSISCFHKIVSFNEYFLCYHFRTDMEIFGCKRVMSMGKKHVPSLPPIRGSLITHRSEMLHTGY